MITITKFPQNKCSMSSFIDVFNNIYFELRITWLYSDDGDLIVRIYIGGAHGDGLQNAISAFLSANQFEYSIGPDSNEELMSSQLFTIVPKPQQDRLYQSTMEKTSLVILLATLLKEKGSSYNVFLTGTMNGIQIAASILNKKTISDAKIVFGHQYRLIPSDCIHWFNYTEKDHGFLLNLPYLVEGACSLVTGYGDKHQVTSTEQKNDVVIGSIFNDALSRKLCFTTNNWSSSTCIWGAPGYGKTTLCMNLVLNAYLKQQLNFVVIEPKNDYCNLKKIIRDLQIIRPVHKYNPLVPPRDCSPYEYVEVLLNMFRLASPTPIDSIFPDYLRRVYLQIIADNNYSIHHFVKRYNELMKNEGYDARAINFIISGRTRIDTFFRMFCGENYLTRNLPGFDVSMILSRPTVIEIGEIWTAQLSSIFTYFIVSHIRMYTRKKLSKNINNCLLIEEAHSVLSPTIDEGVRYELSNLLAEGRGHGLSVIICEQSPSRIDTSATNLCGNVLSFRVTSQSDQIYVSSQLGIESGSLNKLQKFCIWTRTNNMYQPELIRVESDKRILSY